MISSVDMTPENFVHAVQTLYHDHDATRKKLASEWLLNVQSSVNVPVGREIESNHFDILALWMDLSRSTDTKKSKF